MGVRLIPIGMVDPSPFAHLSPPDKENQERIRADLEAHRGEILNPLHVIKTEDGRWELLGGHDRLAAAKAFGLDEVPIRDFTGMVATDDEKVSHLLRDNNNRKDPPKRPGVEWALREHPEWSNRRIAEVVGCDEKMVRTVRTDLEQSGEVRTVRTIEGRDGVEQPARKPPIPKLPDATPSQGPRERSEAEPPRSGRPADMEPEPRTKPTGKAPKYDKLGSLRAAREQQTSAEPDPKPLSRKTIKVPLSQERIQRANAYQGIAALIRFADIVRNPETVAHKAALLREYPFEFYDDERYRVADLIEAGEVVLSGLPAFLDAIRPTEEETGANA